MTKIIIFDGHQNDTDAFGLQIFGDKSYEVL